MATQAIMPATIKAKLFDCFSVFIVSMDARAVIMNKKNGKDSKEFRF